MPTITTSNIKPKVGRNKSASTSKPARSRQSFTKKPRVPRSAGRRKSRYASTSASRSKSRLLDDLGLAPTEVLSLAHAVYRIGKWQSAARATSSKASASWESVYSICQDVDAYKAFQSDHPGFAVTGEDEAAAAEILLWAQEQLRSSTGKARAFYTDLVAAIQADEVYSHTFAIVCSAAAAFRYDRDRHVSENYVGAVGVRQTFILTLKKISSVTPKKKRRRASYRLGFWDDSGNNVVWFSLRHPDLLGIAVDQTYAIEATVRRHEQYKGSKNTIVNPGALKLTRSAVSPSVATN